jgi:hypothetical protein
MILVQSCLHSVQRSWVGRLGINYNWKVDHGGFPVRQDVGPDLSQERAGEDGWEVKLTRANHAQDYHYSISYNKYPPSRPPTPINASHLQPPSSPSSQLVLSLPATYPHPFSYSSISFVLKVLLPLLHHLSDRMPDRNARPLNLLLTQPRRHTHFQRGLRLPDRFFGRAGTRHAFEAGDEHAVGESLTSTRRISHHGQKVGSDRNHHEPMEPGATGIGKPTSSTISCIICS